MRIITLYLVALFLSITVNNAVAQENDKCEQKLEFLKERKNQIVKEEKVALKLEVEQINGQFKNKEIDKEEAKVLKEVAARKRALNIENRVSIVDNMIEFVRRNKMDCKMLDDPDDRFSVLIGPRAGKMGVKFYGKNKPSKYDVRTSTVLVFATGANNVIMDGKSTNESPYDTGKSGFIELGWHFKTRVLNNSNFLRFKYGLSMQWNKLSPKNNEYFVRNGDQVVLEEFPHRLKKVKLRNTNLTLPLHLELGPSIKLDRENIRYINNNQFKIGIGGYMGVHLGSKQKLKYLHDGNVNEKIKKNYNATDFIYGLSGYVGVGDLSIYAKYDLSPIFKNQTEKQRNISLGLRVDLD